MADSFSQIYIHLVFAVQFRESLILPRWEDELYKYTTSRIQSLNQLVLEINGMPDHLHTLIRMKPTCLLSDLVREVKKSTGNFIRDKRYSTHRFAWQDGYGAFSCHQKDVDYVRGYIKIKSSIIKRRASQWNIQGYWRKQTFRQRIGNCFIFSAD